jgi:hypothetical protein
MMMYLQYGITEVSISSKNIELPEDIIISLRKRGKKSRNFKFDKEDNSINIYCVKCKQFHKIYTYSIEKHNWIDTGKFKRSKERGSKNLYFGSDCKLHSIDTKNEKNCKLEEVENKKVKTTLFLEDDLFKYIGIVAACNNRSRTEVINSIIRDEKKRNPIGKYLPSSI